MDKVRVLRIIEYVGNRKWVEETLKRGEIPSSGSKSFGNECVIKSALIDQFPEIVQEKSDETYLDDTEMEMTAAQKEYMDGVGGWIQRQSELLK